MIGRVLVAYATRKGSTREVAETVAGTLRAEGLDVELHPAAEVGAVDGFDAVIVGGAIYMGRWHRDARRFLARHRTELRRVPVAVFGMGPRTLDEQDVAASRAQLERSLAAVPEVTPVATAIFGGVLDPDRLHFPFDRMPACDARDWVAIREWSESVASAFECRGAAA